MADGDTTTATTTTTTAAPPWHAGVDAEIIGHIQNKGWPIDDAKAVAIEAIKAHRGVQKLVGAPPERMLLLPDKPDAPEWSGVWERLGAPKEAAGYDFTAIKDAAGEPLDAKLADALRATAATSHLPKDAAAEIARSVVKHLDSVRAEETAVKTAKLAEERATLDKNWGTSKDINMLHARTGAAKLGIPPEAIAALESQVGYAATMEAMRRVGALGAEDPFVDGGKPGGPTTRDGAIARKNELLADDTWQKRLLAGDVATMREWNALETLIAQAA